MSEEDWGFKDSPGGNGYDDVIKLSKDEATNMAMILDNPPEPNEKLMAAAKSYNEKFFVSEVDGL